MYNPLISNIGGSGRHQSIDYVNNTGAAISAGTIIVIDGIAHVANCDIAIGALGSLVARGGVWRVNKDAAAWTSGLAVYYHATGNPNVGTAGTGAFNQTASGGVFFGYAVMSPDTQLAAAAGDQFGYVLKDSSLAAAAS